jgi:hypothetical protein
VALVPTHGRDGGPWSVFGFDHRDGDNLVLTEAPLEVQRCWGSLSLSVGSCRSVQYPLSLGTLGFGAVGLEAPSYWGSAVCLFVVADLMELQGPWSVDAVGCVACALVRALGCLVPVADRMGMWLPWSVDTTNAVRFEGKSCRTVDV